MSALDRSAPDLPAPDLPAPDLPAPDLPVPASAAHAADGDAAAATAAPATPPRPGWLPTAAPTAQSTAGPAAPASAELRAPSATAGRAEPAAGRDDALPHNAPARGGDRARRVRPRLWVLSFGAALLLGVLVCTATVAAAAALRSAGPGQCALAGAAAGGAVAMVGAAVTAAWAHRAGRTLRDLRDDAVRRLHEPTAAAPDGAAVSPHPGRAVDIAEVADLTRVLDALQLRVRLADEVAARHRRAAETASAGMFELLSGLVAAEEGARGQLAAELHDTAAQSLAVARAHLASGAVERAVDAVGEAEDQVRAVMARTRPPALRDGDLAAAVQALRDDVRQRYALEVEVRWPAEPRPLPLVVAVTVYRFFQEGLLNVVKHADVDTAVVALEFDTDDLVAVVRDDGAGFTPGSVTPDRGRHVGLGLLTERVRLVGGSVTVDAAPGAGCRLVLRLPAAATRGRLSAPQESRG